VGEVYLPLATPKATRGEGEAYFHDNDIETKTTKVMHIFYNSVKIFSDA
jgi:hypothetical protein